MVAGWRAAESTLYKRESELGSPVVDHNKLKDKKVIGLISHDGKKLDLCCLVVEYLPVILRFDYILATASTASWMKKFLQAAARHMDRAPSAKEIDDKVICCLSGPHGGDVQIMHAVLSGYCDRVIFLIDPMEAHPHDPDINFFEQVIEQTSVILVENIESARTLLNSARAAFDKESMEEYQKFWLQ